jgi:NAD(P)H-quinone oxidoreductase subunit 5
MESLVVSSLVLPILVSLPLLSACLSNAKRNWQLAEILGASSFLMVLLAGIILIWPGITFTSVDWLAFTPLRATLLLLVSFIAYIVLRYARTNFASDPSNATFLRWLTLTIFAVMLTISSNHLVVFWFAWLSISLSLHKLLVFYPSRYRAVLAAHKKFIFARIAELCLGAAFLLLYNYHNTFLISEILQQYPSSSISWQQEIAAILISLVALIKCAQLPLHGWLIQVVESPTPVSALLHAGIINLGGFLILLFAPLFSQVAFAQWLLLIIAGLTASFAALVMITRISVKVRLAWSTTAQMGLMLVECALGLYELALLHLVAHSCYKVHAFLSAGSAVSDHIKNQYVGKTQVELRVWLATTMYAILLVTIMVGFLGSTAPLSPWVLLVMALAVSLAIRSGQSGSLALFKGLLDGLFIAALYVLFKWGAGLLLPPIGHAYIWQADAWISTLFIGGFTVYFFLQHLPLNSFSQKLFIVLNAGFYIDEWVTRATLYIWPIRLPKKEADKILHLNAIH